MHPLEEKIQEIHGKYYTSKITKEEKDNLVTNIKNIQIAEECLDNPAMAEHLRGLCDFVLSH